MLHSLLGLSNVASGSTRTGGERGDFQDASRPDAILRPSPEADVKIGSQGTRLHEGTPLGVPEEDGVEPVLTSAWGDGLLSYRDEGSRPARAYRVLAVQIV